MSLRASTIALLFGAAAFALILGALGFQYFARLPPCELCMWQRYPLIAAGCIGIGGYACLRMGALPAGVGAWLAVGAALLIAVSGAIGVYHAGVEWHWWRGPAGCTGGGFRYTGGGLDLNAPVVMCDHAAWRLFGLSLAGYNALISLGLAALGLGLLARTERHS
jgi:disulfide bond formation protein DsbB